MPIYKCKCTVLRVIERERKSKRKKRKKSII